MSITYLTFENIKQWFIHFKIFYVKDRETSAKSFRDCNYSYHDELHQAKRCDWVSKEQALLPSGDRWYWKQRGVQTEIRVTKNLLLLNTWNFILF